MVRSRSGWGVWLLVGAAACNGDALSPAGPDGTFEGRSGDDGLGAGGADEGTSDGADGDGNDDGCVGTKDYFAEVAFPRVFAECLTCHVPGGVSGATRFVLFPETVENYLALNYDVVDRARSLEAADGTSLLIAKPTERVSHGGKRVIARGSDDEATLERLFDEMAAPVTCASDPTLPSADDVLSGLVLLDAPSTLRKAMLSLVGRAPTAAELTAAREQGFGGVDAVLLDAMKERGFHDRLLEMWNDVFLTDRALAANGGGVYSSFDPALFPNLGYAGEVWLAPGELVADSLAREPLEMVAHIIMNDRPLSEIVTAQYRLVNPMTAEALSADVTFADASDPHEWRETQLPQAHEYAPGKSEYAGVLTTNAFLEVVTGAATNRNRRRARYVYQWFLDFDIMKTATRVDFSTVDFTANPWRHDGACTGCHAKIDPLAGLFQNWTNCYDSGYYKYFKQGERYCGDSGLWYGDDVMFAPGFGEHEPLAAAQLPEGLEQLAAYIVDDPRFARAMVRHVFAGVVGRPTLEAPQNLADPRFASLQAAYDAERATVDELATWFRTHDFDTKRLILRIVRSPYFRANDADEAGRAELAGLGTGGLVSPESMHRRLLALLGQSWGEEANATEYESPSRSAYYLIDFKKLRLHAGGTDSKNAGQRLERPSGLTSSVFTRMAYEMACRVVPLELSAAPSARRLLRGVDAGLAPTGDADDASQRPILKALQTLHATLLGESLALDSEELHETYELLTTLHSAGQTESSDLGPCRAQTNFATGDAVPNGLTEDPDYVVRAWQGVVSYLLMDAKFLFE